MSALRNRAPALELHEMYSPSITTAPHDCAHRCAGLVHGRTYNPWEHFTEIWEPQGWQLIEDQRLPPRILGLTDWSQRVVWLDPRLREGKPRSVLAHEIVHLEQGPALDDHALSNRAELICERLAAHRLVTFSDLMWAAPMSDSAEEMASYLDADLNHLRMALAMITRHQHQQMLRFVNLHGMAPQRRSSRSSAIGRGRATRGKYSITEGDTP